LLFAGAYSLYLWAFARHRHRRYHQPSKNKMKIPNERVPLAYQISKDVYEGKITQNEAKKILVGDNEMNPNSASDYIYNFKNMLKGKIFTRTLNAFSMNYFLENILSDYGLESLKKALVAFNLHIPYYEKQRNTTMHGMREIYDRFLKKTNLQFDEIEQSQIIKSLLENNSDREKIITSLKNLTPKSSKKVTINSISYKRNNHTVAKIKILRKFECQICGIKIKKEDGSYYIEAAHISPKKENGPETPDNILILCPNHHKEFDYGKLEIKSQSKKVINFYLNGVQHSISLEIK
jgi:predicted HNH restriction endonuclease